MLPHTVQYLQLPLSKGWTSCWPGGTMQPPAWPTVLSGCRAEGTSFVGSVKDIPHAYGLYNGEIEPGFSEWRYSTAQRHHGEFQVKLLRRGHTGCSSTSASICCSLTKCPPTQVRRHFLWRDRSYPAYFCVTYTNNHSFPPHGVYRLSVAPAYMCSSMLRGSLSFLTQCVSVTQGHWATVLALK